MPRTATTRPVEDSFLEYQRKRSPEALADVYDRTSVRLLAVAMHLCPTAAEAEDAVQDTFLAALEHPERWDAARPLVPWLLGILGNRVRRARTRAAREPDIDRLTTFDPDDPTAALESEELLRSVEDAIEHLAQPYRSVVLLRIRNGLSPADIAIALDRNPSTIRAQLTRGLQMLRRLLPAGFAAGLLVSLTAARGLAAVREVVLGRARAAHEALRVARHTELLRLARRALLGAGTVAALALAVAIPWQRWRGEPEAPHVLLDDDVAIAELDNVETTRIVIEDRDAPASGRIDADARGAVRYLVLRTGVPARGALLSFEPLGEPAGLLLHQWSDSRGVYVVPEPSEDPGPHRVTATTDREGRCELDRLAPGQWLVRGPACHEVVAVRGGETVERILALPDQSCTVRGVVIDDRGAPIAGASIGIATRLEVGVPDVVASTGPDGRFEVVAADFSTVGASAPGRAPVALALDRTHGMTRDVVLRLDRPGSALEGTVVDADQRPIPHAIVQVGHDLDTRVRTEAEPSPLASPVRVRAGADGRFSVEGLAPGEAWVRADAPGFADPGRLVDIARGDMPPLRLVLQRTATVIGRVTDAGGRPVARARVSAGTRGRVDFTATTTDADGRYRLVDVAPGASTLTASDFEGSAAHATLEREPGQVLEWNPTIARGPLKIAGRVTYPDGSPLIRGWVSRGVTDPNLVPTDEDGRFTCSLSDHEVRQRTAIAVFGKDPRRGDEVPREFPLVVVHGVRPGTQDLDVRVPAARYPHGWISGRVVDERGEPPTETVSLRDLETEKRRRVQFEPLGADGSFASGPIPAGRYTIVVRTEPLRQFGPFVVRPGEPLDVGTLRFDRTAPRSVPTDQRLEHLVVFLAPDDAGVPGAVHVEVRDPDRKIVADRYVPRHSDGSWRERIRLPSGRLHLTATASTGLHAAKEIVVDDAEPQYRAILILLSRPR